MKLREEMRQYSSSKQYAKNNIQIPKLVLEMIEKKGKSNVIKN